MSNEPQQKTTSGEMRATLPSLSFVFPMYNEIGNVERCVAEALATGRKITTDLEIVLVDDASTDGCGRLADELAERHPELKVVHHAQNRKLGGALRTGFTAASKDWILYIDSDLPIVMDDALQSIPQTEGADMVIGNRQGRAEGPKRELMSWIYNRLIRVLFGLNVRDVNFAFKLFRRSILERISLQSEGSFIDAELLIETHRAGFRIAELPLRYYERTAGVSTLASGSVVIKILREMAQYRRAAAQRRARPVSPRPANP